MSKLVILDQTGHTEVEYETELEIENARQVFEDMVKAGYLAYAIRRTEEEVKEKVIVYDFDPEELEIVLTPMLRGG